MGVYLGGTLLLGILGILVMSGEYATGTIRATLAAAPRRPMVLAAKVLVFGAVTLVAAEVTAFAGFFLGQALLTSPAPHATLSSPGALRAVAGIGLFLCVVGLLALGIAVLVRHTAAAISAYVGVILVLPILVSALPGSLQHQIERLLPLEIGSVMINNSAPDAFGPWTGFVILCGYTAVILVLGAVLLVRRDA
jgi:ABC-type transport system involved in multi-copper enzyme maturation permease subunit